MFNKYMTTCQLATQIVMDDVLTLQQVVCADEYTHAHMA